MINQLINLWQFFLFVNYNESRSTVIMYSFSTFDIKTSMLRMFTDTTVMLFIK